MKRIYVDTNVLLYWLLPSRPATAKPCTDFMRDVESGGKYLGIISNLALNEMIKGIRNILVAGNKTDAACWRSEVDRALHAIYELNENFVIVSGTAEEAGPDASMSFGAMSVEATNLIKDHEGTARTRSGRGTVHDGLSTADTLHAVLAKRMNCSQIATFDNDFDELSDYMPRMNVREAYPA